jgi:RHS repeat-associated protein
VEIPSGTAGRTGIWGVTDYLNPKSTAQDRDSETGIDFSQARYHANAQGRFLSADPMSAGSDQTNPQSWNGYPYVQNSPLSWVDLTGLDPDSGDCDDNPDGCGIGIDFPIGWGGGGDNPLPPPAPFPVLQFAQRSPEYNRRLWPGPNGDRLVTASWTRRVGESCQRPGCGLGPCL